MLIGFVKIVYDFVLICHRENIKIPSHLTTNKKIMRMKKILISFFAGLILVSFIGCSGGVKVSGTVTYSDGSPLTLGSVVLTNGTNQHQGDINTDGTFRITGVRPKGTYQVCIANTTEVKYLMKKNENGEEVADERVETAHVAAKFCSTETSGLTIDATKSTKFDIVVEHP
jgi:hypothetical protein